METKKLRSGLNLYNGRESTMSAELKIIDLPALDQAEQAELDANIDTLITAHKNNRQEINRLVFDSVAAMTMGEDYERQLANKKGLRRFLGGITGSNKKLQNKINSSRAAAQYAAQQTLQRLAEQNLMSFDLIAAVNNKLNASVIGIENEINEIYGALTTFFKQSKSDIIKLESRVERLERNVNLLNWQNAIEYQMFNGVEYPELDNVSKIVCLTRDFYDITKGEWTTSDLLLLKSAMSTIEISPRDSINFYDFIQRITYDGALSDYLLGGKQIQSLPEPYLIPLLGMKKLELLDGEESYVVDAIMEQMEENHILVGRRSVQSNLARRYLRQETQVDVDAQVNHYDLIMEMLFNLQQAQNDEILVSPGEEVIENESESDAERKAKKTLDTDFGYGDGTYNYFTSWSANFSGMHVNMHWMTMTMRALLEGFDVDLAKREILNEATKYLDRCGPEYFGNEIADGMCNYITGKISRIRKYLDEHPGLEITVDLSKIEQAIEETCHNFIDEELGKEKYWMLFDERRFEFTQKEHLWDDEYTISLSDKVGEEMSWTFDILATVLEKSIERFLEEQFAPQLRKACREINKQIEEKEIPM